MFPRIAAAVGACQFVFIGFAKSRAVTEAFRARLGACFRCVGMDAEHYCVILPPMPQERFVAAVGLADVVLDTPGWSGGKSTLDCLAQDPAIVTWPGRFMRGRHTAAILRRIGCEATIAGSLDEYVAIAARLGRTRRGARRCGRRWLRQGPGVPRHGVCAGAGGVPGGRGGAMPTIAVVDEVKIRMFFNNHTPAHFHAIQRADEVLMEVKERAADILGCKADIMTRRSLHPVLREQIEASAQQVF